MISRRVFGRTLAAISAGVLFPFNAFAKPKKEEIKALDKTSTVYPEGEVAMANGDFAITLSAQNDWIFKIDRESKLVFNKNVSPKKAAEEFAYWFNRNVHLDKNP